MLTVKVSGNKALEKLRWLVNLDKQCEQRGITYSTPYEAAYKYLETQGYSARTLNKLAVEVVETED